MGTYCQSRSQLKDEFLSKFIKQGQSFHIKSVAFPINTFNPKVQIMVIVLSPIMGLDNDRVVNEFILGFIITMESTQ